MTNAITEINDELASEAPASHDELLTSDDLVSLPTKRLPFSYARRTGVLLSKDQDNWTVYYRGELDVDALLEEADAVTARVAAMQRDPEAKEADESEAALEASEKEGTQP